MVKQFKAWWYIMGDGAGLIQVIEKFSVSCSYTQHQDEFGQLLIYNGNYSLRKSPTIGD